MVISVRGNILFGVANFAPLVHFHFSLESVAIASHDAHVLVNDLGRVLCFSSYVDKLELIHAIRIVGFNSAHTFAPLVDALGKCDDFLFVFPKEDKREWN